tara:strand:+ start:581 stop:1480 length:900 start_codon:yes stop_codon:yes gene_type:complete
MLKSILMVWVLAQNLALTQEAYEDYLGYRSVDEGVMSVELAAAIDRPELMDRRFVTMMPRSGPQVGLRLVEGDASGYVPMQRVGWSAIELLVQDPEQLEAELAGSAFTHLQGPDFLTEQKNILAMQVTGPNRELFYLTRMIDPSKSFLQPQPSPEPVGHTFIMVMGSPDLEASLSFWRRHFDTNVVGPIPYRIGVLSDAYDLPQDTLHSLALVSMSDGYGIEIDQYPEGASAVPAPEGERGGVILVSLSVDPEGLKAPLPWRLPYIDTAGAVEGGVIILPSGAPIEVALTTAMLPAPAD